MYFLCIRPQIKTCLSVCLSVSLSVLPSRIDWESGSQGGDVCSFARRNGTKSHRPMCSSVCRCLFPFRKRLMPLLTVDVIIGNDAFQNGWCWMMVIICWWRKNAVTKCLIFHIHTGLLAGSFYLLFGATLSLTFKKVTFCDKILRKIGGSIW